MSRNLINGLVRRYGKQHRKDIERGVAACKRVWNFKKDGEDAFEAFCLGQYVPAGRPRTVLLNRLDEFHHTIVGNMGASIKVARAGQDIADRPLIAAEEIFSAFTPDTHLLEDYRRSKVAAVAQLNFGTDDRSSPRSRSGWAARRLGDIGREVIPAGFLADLSLAQTESDRFISAYNLHLDRFDFGDSQIRFPAGTRLISHWGLRDTMTQLNGEKKSLPKQRAILDLMRRVVDGEIPAEVLDNPRVRWDIARSRIRENGKSRPAEGHGPLRWEKFRKVWRARLKIDPYTRHGNVIDNKFLVEREIAEEKVVKVLTEIVSSPLAERVAPWIRDRLGRDLEPFDVYFRDFHSSGPGKPKLRYDIRKRYPDSAALHSAIPDILGKLGWKRDRARWIASKIRVDNGRSAGHAWPPANDHDLQLLRVRVDAKGCDEINFETFMHELGHCVEGVLTSYDLDFKALWSVPNTAFSEGFAFTFQDRTDEVLGRRRPGGVAADVTTLLRFWEPYEIAGSALTEIRLYHWLYENRGASASRILRAVRRIGDEVWDEFYARIFGAAGHGLMSVYSHMLWGEFYLAEYPLGYVLAYQVRKHLEGRPLAKDMERICALGRIYPEDWMKAAVGQKISVEPLLDDTRAALHRLGY